MGKYLWWYFFSVLYLLVQKINSHQPNEAERLKSRCYNHSGQPQRCVPAFMNLAHNEWVEVTNTCGEKGPSEYCYHIQGSKTRRVCLICDARNPRLAHSPEYLTDLNSNENETWWQSGTMYEDAEWPNSVNLTLHLKKAFEITYIRLKFHSSRPESFTIYKRTTEADEWVPYQYYSLSCQEFYSVPDVFDLSHRQKNPPQIKGADSRALCTSEFSDISPLSGGITIFSTLENRPSAYSLDTSKELQDFITATDIRISLDRHNTFGDEIYSDPKVLKSYFYAITDFAVGGRCKCNGHASDCVVSSVITYLNVNVSTILRESIATNTDAHECIACNCSGFSDRCFFDQRLYEITGHGGHCVDCTSNRDGPNCERCKRNYIQRVDGYCVLEEKNKIDSGNSDSDLPSPSSSGLERTAVTKPTDGEHSEGTGGDHIVVVQQVMDHEPGSNSGNDAASTAHATNVQTEKERTETKTASPTGQTGTVISYDQLLEKIDGLIEAVKNMDRRINKMEILMQSKN